MFGELWQIPSVRRPFIGSSGTPVQGVKRHNHVFLPSEITELELMSLFARNCGQFNLRRHLSSLQSCHLSSSIKIWPAQEIMSLFKLACCRSVIILSWSNNLRQGSLKKTAGAPLASNPVDPQASVLLDG